MSLRAVFLLLMSMFASSALVFVLMWAVMSPPGPRAPRPRVRVRTQRPSPTQVHPPEANPTAWRDATRRSSPVMADRPLPTPPAHILAAPEATEVEERAALVARMAAQRLDEMESDLQRQVAALKKSRDRMLDDLARELEAMIPQEAAREVATLDDESGSLALSRLSVRQRRAVLAELTPAQAARLRLKLGNTAAR